MARFKETLLHKKKIVVPYDQLLRSKLSYTPYKYVSVNVSSLTATWNPRSIIRTINGRLPEKGKE
jgi:hypothetical protein